MTRVIVPLRKNHQIWGGLAPRRASLKSRNTNAEKSLYTGQEAKKITDEESNHQSTVNCLLPLLTKPSEERIQTPKTI